MQDELDQADLTIHTLRETIVVLSDNLRHAEQQLEQRTVDYEQVHFKLQALTFDEYYQPPPLEEDDDNEQGEALKKKEESSVKKKKDSSSSSSSSSHKKTTKKKKKTSSSNSSTSSTSSSKKSSCSSSSSSKKHSSKNTKSTKKHHSTRKKPVDHLLGPWPSPHNELPPVPARPERRPAHVPLPEDGDDTTIPVATTTNEITTTIQEDPFHCPLPQESNEEEDLVSSEMNFPATCKLPEEDPDELSASIVEHSDHRHPPLPPVESLSLATPLVPMKDGAPIPPLDSLWRPLPNLFKLKQNATTSRYPPDKYWQLPLSSIWDVDDQEENSHHDSDDENDLSNENSQRKASLPQSSLLDHAHDEEDDDDEESIASSDEEEDEKSSRLAIQGTNAVIGSMVYRFDEATGVYKAMESTENNSEENHQSTQNNDMMTNMGLVNRAHYDGIRLSSATDTADFVHQAQALPPPPPPPPPPPVTQQQSPDTEPDCLKGPRQAAFVKVLRQRDQAESQAKQYETELRRAQKKIAELKQQLEHKAPPKSRKPTKKKKSSSGSISNGSSKPLQENGGSNSSGVAPETKDLHTSADEQPKKIVPETPEADVMTTSFTTKVDEAVTSTSVSEPNNNSNSKEPAFVSLNGFPPEPNGAVPTDPSAPTAPPREMLQI